ncbi:MAG: choice-of-anchor tandem repeat GloVer-containing protein [Thermosynechococcaceae cyanobacterium]
MKIHLLASSLLLEVFALSIQAAFSMPVVRSPFNSFESLLPTHWVGLVSEESFPVHIRHSAPLLLAPVASISPTGSQSIPRVNSLASFQLLASFDVPNGVNPTAGLVRANNGNFYGTTARGGLTGAPNCIATAGCGTVFRITPTGQKTTLVAFDGTNNLGLPSDGTLVQGRDGNFYGTTNGGISSSNFGTAYRMTPTGKLTKLAQFDFYNTGGAPHGLIQAKDGNLYGTAETGGAFSSSLCASRGCGAVFRLSSAGNLTILAKFNGTNGSKPTAGLLQASNGSFYGTTSQGGNTTACLNGCGTIFRMSATGKITTLVKFKGSNGADPEAELIQGSDGNLYGNTAEGGKNNAGTLFRMSPNGSLTILYHFNISNSNGRYPKAALVQGRDGFFYGTTTSGNFTNPGGTVFRVTRSGVLTTLINLTGFPASASNSIAKLVEGNSRQFWGTSVDGGALDRGTVFRVSVN